MGNTITDGSAVTAPSYITSTSAVKTYLGISDSTYDTVLAALVAKASAMVEDACGRHIISASYAKWLDGTGEDRLYLPETPVTAVSRISIGTDDAMAITCEASDATHATVSVTDTYVICTVSDGASAATNSLAIGTYTTMATMAAAINALSGSWTAEVLGTYDSFRTSTLREMPSQFCLNTNARILMPSEPEADFVFHEDEGYVQLRAGGFMAGHGNIYAAWTAGYSTIPAAVQQVCIELVANLFHQRKRDTSLSGETLGDYSWRAASGASSASGGAFGPDLHQRLGKYRDVLP